MNTLCPYIKCTSKEQVIAYLTACLTLKNYKLNIAEFVDITAFVNQNYDRYPFIALYKSNVIAMINSGFIDKKEVTFGEFFDILLTNQNTMVKLNLDYTAEIQKNGDVKIGCQTFSSSFVKTFIAAYQQNIK